MIYTVPGSLDDMAYPDAFWLSQLGESGTVDVNTTFLNDLDGLLAHFSPRLSGYVRYSDPSEASASITLAAGAEGGVVAVGSSSTATRLEALGVRVLKRQNFVDAEEIRAFGM